MSTICKIDKSVRTQRTDRANMLRFFATRAGHRTPMAVACIGFHQRLRRLRLDPRFSGVWKNQTFRSITDDYARKLRETQAPAAEGDRAA